MCNVIIFGLPAGDAYNFVINVVSAVRFHFSVSHPSHDIPPQISYPLAVINAIISFGLLYIAAKARYGYAAIHSRWERRLDVLPSDATSNSERQPLIPESHPPNEPIQEITFDLSPVSLFSAVIFGIASVFLFIMPLAKPPPGIKYYDHLPYWIHAAGGWGVFIIGAMWWWYRSRFANTTK